MRSLRKNYVQIINNKEAPWITLSKQHLAHDSQLEQQLSLGSLLLRDAHCGNNQFLAINWIWMKFAKMLFFLQDWILNFMRENSNFASVWFFAAAESSLVLSWHFSIAYKGIKRKKEKKLAWGRAEAWETASTACKFRKSRSELRRGSYISTLWDVLSITTDILFKSSSSKTTMGIVDLTTNLQS